MKLRLFLVLSFALHFNGFGQQRPHALIYHNPLASIRSAEVQAPTLKADTLRVLGLMVNFPTDQDASTTGNGQFQLQTNVTGLIDPPPHDSSFFANKLRFIENYFHKVSNGQLTVKGDLLGRVITVSKLMASYAPPNNNNGPSGLANLAIESWKAADSLISGIPFSQYQAFMIFHAGVGHDIDVIGFLGFDPSPNDLPSLYLGLKSFQNALQDPTFQGIQTRSGFRITNTTILPETDTRIFASSSGNDTVKLSINGLAASSIGSYLGLPDLFNTKTGRPGIGQFGLMDGASIFAYSGLFPPEPSAWEKVFLGWVTPITLNASKDSLPIPAVGLTSTGQDTIYKIPISTSEYFLVENRNRDPQNNGQKLTIFEKGVTRTETYPHDTTGFSFDDISRISGSVIDVDDFDWALIGDTRGGDQFVGGGILIWHIDERIIQQGLETNSVNADENHRGVNLEEADGSPDIGQVYGFLDPGEASTSGSPLDCWFNGNPAQPYQNVFDKRSFPNSNANSGVQSLISVKNFSSRLPRMTFSVSIGESNVKQISGLTRLVGRSSSDNSPQVIDNAIFVSKGDSIFSFRFNGKCKVPDSTGLFSAVGGSFPVAANVLSSSGQRYILGIKDSTLLLYSPVDANGDSVYDSVPSSSINIGNRITTPPSIYNGSSLAGAVVGDAGGNVTVVSLSPYSKVTTTNISLSPIFSLIVDNTNSSTIWYATSSDRIYKQSGERYIFPSSIGGYSVGSGQIVAVLDTIGRKLYLLDNKLNLIKTISLGQYSGQFSSPVIADVNRDGRLEVLIPAGDKLLAFNSSGFLVDGFPVALNGTLGRSSSIAISDLNGDGDVDLLVVNSQGVIQVLNSHGNGAANLSVDVGNLVSGSPLVFLTQTGVGVSVVDTSGYLRAWEYATAYSGQNTLWQGKLNNASHSNFGSTYSGSTQPLANSFFPKDRVYNWPNPVYGKTTQIRFYTSEDAAINVKVFDLAGFKVAELAGKSYGGTDSEIIWDVSNIQSGVYFARVEATSSSAGDFTIIKIAVVK